MSDKLLTTCPTCVLSAQFSKLTEAPQVPHPAKDNFNKVEEPLSEMLNIYSSHIYSRRNRKLNNYLMPRHFSVSHTAIYIIKQKVNKYHNWRLKTSATLRPRWLQSLSTTPRTSNLRNSRVITLCARFLTCYFRFASMWVVVTNMKNHIIESTLTI